MKNQSMKLRLSCHSILLLIIAILAMPMPAQSAVISGTISYQDGTPAAGIPIYLNWFDDGIGLVTDGRGFYSHTIPEGSELNLHVTPPTSLRLVYRNINIPQVTGMITRNFVLEQGYLVTGTVKTSDGQVFVGGGWMGASPLYPLPEAYGWLGDGIDYDNGTFAIVLPPRRLSDRALPGIVILYRYPNNCRSAQR